MTPSTNRIRSTFSVKVVCIPFNGQILIGEINKLRSEAASILRCNLINTGYWYFLFSMFDVLCWHFACIKCVLFSWRNESLNYPAVLKYRVMKSFYCWIYKYCDVILVYVNCTSYFFHYKIQTGEKLFDMSGIWQQI